MDDMRKAGSFNIFRKRSMALEIAMTTVIAATIVATISLVINLYVLTKRDAQEFNFKADERLSFLTNSLELPFWNYDPEAVIKIGRTAMTNDITSSLVIKDDKGNTIFAEQKNDETDLIIKDAKIVYEGTLIGSIQLGLTKNIYKQRQQKVFNIGALTIFVMVTCIAFIVIVLVTFLIRRPLNEFSKRIKSLSEGDYKAGGRITPYSELKSITDQFQQMAVRITNREESLREINDKLAESELRYRSLNNNIPVGVFRSTYAGKILSMNPALRKMAGLPDEQKAEGLFAADFYKNPEDRQRMVDELNLNKKVAGFEYDMIKQNGDSIWASMSATAIEGDDGRIIYLDGIIEDITMRKQAETENANLQDQLLQSQKMQAVGHLAGGIAHDFNNMLSVVLGNSELVLTDMEPENPFRDRIKTIQDAAHRSSGLVRQLLAFARKQNVKPILLDINATIANTCTILRKLIGEDIDLVWIPGHETNKVKIDPSQLNQILTNLCVNARDAINGVGKVTIETRNVELDEAYCQSHVDFIPGSYVMLTVSDSGCGMDQQTLRQIFDPFFTTKAIGQGTGLGLATVYGIIQQNNGFINAYSEPEKGSTFKIYLPMTGAGIQGGVSITEVKNMPGGKETVLVVEDDSDVLDLTKAILSQLGYTVIPANNPLEAINLVEKENQQIDLLLTDVVMPQMNGRELAGNLRKMIPDLKMLYMSGYTADVIAHHGILEDDISFLAKPFSISGLAEKVREVIDAQAFSK